MLLDWGGVTVLAYLMEQWKSVGAHQLAVVCAVEDEQIRTELDRLKIPPEERIYNPAPEQGMFSSVRCAASWSGWAPGLTGWVIALGDQPHLRTETLAALVGFIGTHREEVCQPERNGRRRHPVFLPALVFGQLARAKCGSLKEFLSPYPVAACELQDPGLDLDIDEPKDYRRARALAGLP
jgi:CTP:molybdopterin cytidylyltransferase MocA